VPSARKPLIRLAFDLESGSEVRKSGGVIVGANAHVLGGFTVGAGARIGSGAVVVKPVPAGATAVGNPARIIQAEVEAAREQAAAKMGFSAYGVTQGDDPVSQAMKGLIDNAGSHEHQIALLWQAIEKLSAGARELPATADCVPADAQTEERFDGERLNRLVKKRPSTGPRPNPLTPCGRGGKAGSDRLRALDQPGQRIGRAFGLQARRKPLAHGGVVGVEPGRFVVAQQRAFQAAGVDRAQRQRLEFEELAERSAFVGRGGNVQHQVFDPHAPLATAV
jgi:hypothetical protein